MGTATVDASGNAPKEANGIPTLKLNDGNEIPLIGYGLGTARYKRSNFDVLDENIINATLTAIKNGYYHLDGAEAYGNEAELGEAIARSGVDRSKLFVTTKTSCRAGESIETAFSRSLAKLKLDYVDLYLIHSPFWAKSPAELQAKWAEVEALKDSGRARSIGVSNFLPEHLDAVLQTARHPPVINQIEYHPYLQHDASDLLGYLRSKGIAISAYSPPDRHHQGPRRARRRRLRAPRYQGIVALTTSAKEDRLKGWKQRLPLFKLTPEEVKEIAERGNEKHFRGYWTKHFKEDDRR
ncbi:hypothetical protein VTH82DRAFT_8129 [Thermothelomyces myriococcoides]